MSRLIAQSPAGYSRTKDPWSAPMNATKRVWKLRKEVVSAQAQSKYFRE
jgi:hypothetical protein